MSLLIGNPKILNEKMCLKIIKKRKEVLDDLANVNYEMKEILNTMNISVIDNYVNNKICFQLWLRDNLIHLDNKIIVLVPTKKGTFGFDRSPEKNSVIRILDHWKYKYNLIKNKNIKLEGGDVIQNNDYVFVGINERTNNNGYNFVVSKTNKKCFRIEHSALHLDCCFTLLKNNIIIFSKKYIQKLDQNIKKKFKVFILEDIIDTKNTNLALNFIIIGNNIIISNHKRFSKLRQFLRKLGYKLHLVNFKYDYLLYGSIRCFTQWLEKPKYVDIY